MPPYQPPKWTSDLSVAALSIGLAGLVVLVLTWLARLVLGL